MNSLSGQGKVRLASHAQLAKISTLKNEKDNLEAQLETMKKGNQDFGAQESALQIFDSLAKETQDPLEFKDSDWKNDALDPSRKKNPVCSII